MMTARKKTSMKGFKPTIRFQFTPTFAKQDMGNKFRAAHVLTSPRQKKETSHNVQIEAFSGTSDL